MQACRSCGRENPDGFRFCGTCGADLAVEAPAVVRKTVTVLFCDLVGSTALGERTDSELAEVLARDGRTDEARREAETCLRRYEAKGIVPLAERARAFLAGLPA